MSGSMELGFVKALWYEWSWIFLDRKNNCVSFSENLTGLILDFVCLGQSNDTKLGNRWAKLVFGGS
jgi:hypothetical protein